MTSRAKILLVEDNPSIRLLIERLLENCEIAVVAAGSGFEAIDLCRKEKMDLILMDIRMPEMNGYETSARIRQLRTANCDVPIVAITASICDVQFHTYGIDDCIEKPLHTADLCKIINEHLGAVCRI